MLEYAPSFTTGCSRHSRMRTIAIVNSTSVEQLPAAISMAARVLKPASLINNSVHLAIFGTGLSDARPTAVENVKLLKSISEAGEKTEVRPGLVVDKVHLIVGSHDLALLRLVPHVELGEVCHIPGCDALLAQECEVSPSVDQMGEDNISKAIECIRRRPALVFQDKRDLPFKWKQHVDNVNSFDWLQRLWSETVEARADARAASKNDDDDDGGGGTSPFDVLSLCMYAKMVSISSLTTEMALDTLRRISSTVDGAIGLGLMRIFPTDDGDAVPILSFVAQYLEGHDRPWQVSARGRAAAQKARVIVRKVFAHTAVVLSVLKNGKVAEVVTSVDSPQTSSGNAAAAADTKTDGVLLIQGGPAGNMVKLLLGRVPVSVVAVDRAFEVVFTAPSKKGWVDDVNGRLQEIVAALSNKDGVLERVAFERVRHLISTYAALATTHVKYDVDVEDRSSTSMLASQMTRSVTTFPTGIASHVARELVIKENVIQTASTSACVSVQQGTSVSCVFCTFCPTVVQMLQSPRFTAPVITGEGVLSTQRTVDMIAKSISRPYRPLGMLSGILGPVVRLYEQLHRVVYWKNRGENRDSIVTFFPTAYVDIIFADYATGSRNIRLSDTDDETKPPFFVSESIFSLSSTSALDGSNGLAYSLPTLDRIGLLGTDESELYAAYTASLDTTDVVNAELRSALDKSFTTIHVRETEDDHLAGIRVQWMRRGGSGSQGGENPMFALISDNSARESVIY